MVEESTKKLANQILNDIKKNGMAYNDLNDLLDVAKYVLAHEDDVDFAMKITQYVGTCCDYCIDNDIDVVKMYKLKWDENGILHTEAPFLFDSYMLFLEKNRAEEMKFYQPRRRLLRKHGVVQALQDMECDKLDILSISLPPGTGKTTIEKFFATWVMGRHPKDYSLFYSHSDDITRMFYDGVLDIISNDVDYNWKLIFKETELTQTDAKRQQINLGHYKPFYSLQCSSVGSKNAGKVRCNRYLFCDDLIGGIEQALNKSQLDKLWDKYSVDARQRKYNQKCKELHIATRWSVHDVIGRLKSTFGDSKRCRFISVPDIDPVTNESNFDYDYGGMSAEFFHNQELLMDDISYRCLYKNEPIEREGLLYDKDSVRRYLSLPSREPDAVLSVCDTKNKGSDYMVMPVLYVYDSDFYMVDCICNNDSDYGNQYERLSDMIVKHKIQQCQFESNNGGDRIGFEVKKLVAQKGGKCNITMKYTTGNKETKIIVNADWVKKNVLFKDQSMYTNKSDYGMFMSFLFSYSVMGRNVHDDVPDALSMLALFVQNKLKARVSAIERIF